MTWTNQPFVYGSQLLDTELVAVYSNYSAIANASSGAPQIAGIAVASGAFNRDKINSATASISGSPSVNGQTRITMQINTNCFFPMIYVASHANVLETLHGWLMASATNSNYVIRLELNTTASATIGYEVNYRYIA